MSDGENEHLTTQQLMKMLSEFRNEFHKFRDEVLKKLESLSDALEPAKIPSAVPETVPRILQDLEKGSDLLALTTMDLPNHLRATYLFVLDNGIVTANMARDEFGISLSQASVHLRQLAVEYSLIDWRKGESKKGESPHKKYYYPLQYSSRAAGSATNTEERDDELFSEDFKIPHTE